MATQYSDLADLVTTTLNELGENKFTDIMSDYQNTVALKRLMRKNKQTFDSGPLIQFNLITATHPSARFVGLEDVDNPTITNVMTTGSIPWRHVVWDWSVDEREIATNRAPRKIVDLIKTRRIAAFGAAVELFEDALWRVPAVANTTSMYGIPYYVVKSATAHTTNEGFNGTLPSDHTTVAGLSPTTYDRWRNWATTYTNKTKDDLITKMRWAAWHTNFKPLVDSIPEYNTGNDMGVYTNYTTLAALEEILEAQNESLGNDIASKDGKTLFHGGMMEAVKELSDDTTDPVYMLNWGELKTVAQRGRWMKEKTVNPYPGQHNMSTTFTDCTLNLICRNRRRQAVLATGTGMPA